MALGTAVLQPVRPLRNERVMRAVKPCIPWIVLTCPWVSSAFPLFNGGLQESPPPPPAAVDPIPCREHRPLPSIDPAIGLSWLDHIVQDSGDTLRHCLKRVSLGWEELSDEDAPQLMKLMRAGVEVLYLFQNQLGDGAARAIAAALPESGLRELDLAHNSISDEGAAALAAALTSSPTLRILRLNANEGLGNGAAGAFAAAVADVRCPIDELWLSSGQMKGRAAERLRRAWRESGRDEARLVM